jgi:hypothetical protein
MASANVLYFKDKVGAHTNAMVPVCVGDLVRYKARVTHNQYCAVVVQTGFVLPAKIDWHKPHSNEVGLGDLHIDGSGLVIDTQDDYNLLLRVWAEHTEADGDWIGAEQIIEVLSQKT